MKPETPTPAALSGGLQVGKEAVHRSSGRGPGTDSNWLAHRMVSISSRKYGETEEGRKAAALTMARNAIRLALAEAPEVEVGKAILDVLGEPRS